MVVELLGVDIDIIRWGEIGKFLIILCLYYHMSIYIDINLKIQFFKSNFSIYPKKMTKILIYLSLGKSGFTNSSVYFSPICLLASNNDFCPD